MEVNCKYEFKNFCFAKKSSYTCIVENIKITAPNTEIKVFTGEHRKGFNRKNVRAIHFYRTTVNYFPKGLSQLFPKLKTIIIEECNLQSVTREDLVGLGKIERLCLVDNLLTTIPDDLFSDMECIHTISFKSNLISNVSPRFLLPVMKTLELLDLQGNPSVNKIFKGEQLGDLSAEFPKRTGDSCLDTTSNYHDELSGIWSLEPSLTCLQSDEFLNTELSIVVDDQVFTIDSQILAAKSSYLFELFAQYLAVGDPLTRLEISNVSPDSVEEVLKFICNAELPGFNSNLSEIYMLSCQWGLEELRLFCEMVIVEQITPSNVLQIHGMGFKCNSLVLIDSAFRKLVEYLSIGELERNLRPQLVGALNDIVDEENFLDF